MPNLESHALSSPSSLAMVPHSNLVKPIPNRAVNFLTFETLNLNLAWDLNQSGEEVGLDSGESEITRNDSGSEGIGVVKKWAGAENGECKSLYEYVNDWARRRVDAGVSEHRCYLPFLAHAPRMVISWFIFCLQWSLFVHLKYFVFVLADCWCSYSALM